MRTATARFPDSDWAIVLLAKEPKRTLSACALSWLCTAYWQPLCAVLQRRGYSPEDAQDLTQAFLTSVLEKHSLRRIVPEGGRFRAYIGTALLNFAANEYHRSVAQKRGGVQAQRDWAIADEMSVAPADWTTPEALFDRRWAATLLYRVLSRLAAEYERRGKGDLFRQLQRAFGGRRTGVSHHDVGAALQMTESAVRVAVYRLRRRYRELLREEVARTVSDPADVDDEIRYLMKIVSQNHA